MCCKYACQRAAAKLVASRKAAGRGSAGEQKEKTPPTFLKKILQVHGQRDIDPARLIGKKRRNKLAEAYQAPSYLIYIFREFAEDEHDDGFKDFRWVELDDLVANFTERQLKPLVAYEKALEQRMAAKKQKLADELEAAEDDD